jgi:hypothetical protein
VQHDGTAGLGPRQQSGRVLQEERDIRARSSRQSSSRSSLGNSRFRLTPKGRSVSDRASRICRRIGSARQCQAVRRARSS